MTVEESQAAREKLQAAAAGLRLMFLALGGSSVTEAQGRLDRMGRLAFNIFRGLLIADVSLRDALAAMAPALEAARGLSERRSLAMSGDLGTLEMLHRLASKEESFQQNVHSLSEWMAELSEMGSAGSVVGRA